MEIVYADKLYEFLTDMMATAQSQSDHKAVERLDRARKQYAIPLPDGKSFRLPLTSEFLGESMAALQEVLECSKTIFAPEQASKAREYADVIKQRWFSHR